MQAYRDMVDRLLDREQADRWMFLLFATSGSILIWVTKAAGANAVLVAAGAMFVMLGYAALVNVGPKLKLQADQLGDNCYYLGLIFTLASLSFAIFTFDPANTATTIVQGFGVALVSTIMGLVLRVFFSQGRPDLAQAEDNARIALTESAAEVRAQLDGMVLAFATFATQTQQHLTELRDHIREDVTSVSAVARNTIQDAAAAARVAVQEQATEATVEVRRISTAIGRLIKALESHSEVLGSLAEKTSLQLDNLTAIEQAGLAASEALKQVTGSADLVYRYQASLAGNSDKLVAATGTMAETISSLNEAARHFDDLVEGRLAQFGEAPLRVGEQIDAGLRDALQRLQTTFSEHAEAHAEVMRGIEQARADELAATRQHNEALATELSRSREKVRLVHSSLVDMTNELTAQVSVGAGG